MGNTSLFQGACLTLTGNKSARALAVAVSKGGGGAQSLEGVLQDEEGGGGGGGEDGTQGCLGLSRGAGAQTSWSFNCAWHFERTKELNTEKEI